MQAFPWESLQDLAPVTQCDDWFNLTLIDSLPSSYTVVFTCRSSPYLPHKPPALRSFAQSHFGGTPEDKHIWKNDCALHRFTSSLTKRMTNIIITDYLDTYCMIALILSV